MVLNYLKFEFKVLFRKTALFLSIFFPAIFYILFTSILDLQAMSNLDSIKNTCIV